MNQELIDNLFLVGISTLSAFSISFLLRKILSTFISKYATKLNADPTNFSFLKNSVRFVIWSGALVFVVYKIPYLNSIATALFAGAGVLAVVVGFASQKAFANIISGVFILIFKPFKVTETIEFQNGLKGVVEEITLRHTIIKDYENKRIVIPNSVISEETIINSDIQDSNIRKHIMFSISFDSNLDKALEIIEEEALKHPFTLDNRSEEQKQENFPIVTVRVINLSEYSVDIRAYIWTKGNDQAFVLRCDLLKIVKKRFDEEGIEIPFPYRTIIQKKDLNQDE